MKIICKDIIYQEGKFEDVLGNEIRLRDGAEIKIIAFDYEFMPDEVRILQSKDQLKEIQKRKFSSFTKIAERGSHLYFRLRKKEGIIQVELLEDLYLIYRSSLKTERQIFLYSCACQTRDKLNPIRSYSLTDLYKKVYIKESMGILEQTP